jgi:transcriptional regulator with XRE-family HTH domain
MNAAVIATVIVTAIASRAWMSVFVTSSLASRTTSSAAGCWPITSVTKNRASGAELKRLREASGLTPEEAAARLDFSRSKIYRLETGKSRVDADDLDDMLDLHADSPRARLRTARLRIPGVRPGRQKLTSAAAISGRLARNWYHSPSVTPT